MLNLVQVTYTGLQNKEMNKRVIFNFYFWTFFSRLRKFSISSLSQSEFLKNLNSCGKTGTL